MEKDSPGEASSEEVDGREDEFAVENDYVEMEPEKSHGTRFDSQEDLWKCGSESIGLKFSTMGPLLATNHRSMERIGGRWAITLQRMNRKSTEKQKESPIPR